jgi:hypothetical protein
MVKAGHRGSLRYRFEGSSNGHKKQKPGFGPGSSISSACSRIERMFVSRT